MSIHIRQGRYVAYLTAGLCVRPEMPIVVHARTVRRQRRRILNAAAQTAISNRCTTTEARTEALRAELETTLESRLRASEESLLGVYGMLLAIPLAACLKILVIRVVLPRLRAWTRGDVSDPLPIDDGQQAS